MEKVDCLQEAERRAGKSKLHDKAQFIGRIGAAQLLDVSPQTIDKFIRTGRLRAFRVGRKVVVRHDELLRLVEANEIQ